MGRSRRDPQNEQNIKKSIGLISIRLDFGVTFEARTKTRSAAVLAGPGAAVGTLKISKISRKALLFISILLHFGIL